jgi:hypothetical protein
MVILCIFSVKNYMSRTNSIIFMFVCLRRHEFACGDSVERTVKSNILVVGCAGARPGTGDDLISKVSE